jgi:hypothetical protein
VGAAGGKATDYRLQATGYRKRKRRERPTSRPVALFLRGVGALLRAMAVRSSSCSL